MYGDGVRLMEIYSCIKGLSVKVTRAPVSRKNTALAHSARHDVVASLDNAQRRCALSGENPVQRAFPCQKFYVLPLFGQVASSTMSAACRWKS